MVPIGERALAWIDRYQRNVRPLLLVERDLATFFVTAYGQPLSPDALSYRVRCYVEAADVGKKGSCHLFRHTMATLMLERGADVRIIQEILGHSSLDSTQIYTHVSIGHLKQVHEETHPAAKNERPAEPDACATSSADVAASIAGNDAEAGELDVDAQHGADLDLPPR